MEYCYRRSLYVCLNKMSNKKGMQTYNERAVELILREYKQTENLTVFGKENTDVL